MSNDYYTRQNTFSKGVTARGDVLESSLAAIEAGFDKLPDLSKFETGVDSYSVATSTDNAYEITLPSFTSYSEGFGVRIKIDKTNTGASTLNINSSGVLEIRRTDLSVVQAGDLIATSVVTLNYNGAYFILTSALPQIQTAAEAARDIAVTASTTAATAATNASASATAASISKADAGVSATDANNSALSADADRILAETAAAEAVGAVAGVNLPLILAGDAGKMLLVKTDETGYEHAETGINDLIYSAIAGDGVVIGWDMEITTGTNEEPTEVLYSSGDNRVKLNITWVYSNETNIIINVSTNAGSTYSIYATVAIGYDENGNVTTLTWT